MLLALEVGRLPLGNLDLILDRQDAPARRLGPLDLGRNALSVLRCLDFAGRRVTLLGLPGAAREDDQPLLVFLQARHVDGDGFFREVLAAWIDGDADSGRELAGDACFLLR